MTAEDFKRELRRLAEEELKAIALSGHSISTSYQAVSDHLEVVMERPVSEIVEMFEIYRGS